MKVKVFRMSIVFVAVLFCGLFLYYPQIFAADQIPIDVWGTNKITGDELRVVFAKELSEIVDRAMLPGEQTSERIRQGWLLERALSDKIKKMGDFAYVDACLITYLYTPPSGLKEATRYIAVDIVEQKDKHRLAYFLPKPTESIPDPDNLIKLWNECEDKRLVLRGTSRFDDFDHHPQLKQCGAAFNELVPKNKAQLIAILKNDQDGDKRARVPFLLGYIKNNKELIEILLPSMRDPYWGVRNNVMLMIRRALETEDVPVPVDAVVTALDFPCTSGKNKAFYILEKLAKKPNNARYIAQHAGKHLVAALKMALPGFHDTAYDILKTISGQAYGEHDYAAWQKWLASAVSQ